MRIAIWKEVLFAIPIKQDEYEICIGKTSHFGNLISKIYYSSML